ncbi:MAG: cytochrome c maturation protein CcmE [Gemmatimonadaceae bacterium]|nr:cytochrome c maturation protein CcmE [Gemmatimonadaceae bacterium]
MNTRSKFMLGGLLILGTASFLAAKSTAATAQFYLTPHELAERLQADDSFRENGMKVGGRVVPGTIVRAPGNKEVRFVMRDTLPTSEARFTVVYKGIIPDTFTDSVDVVVEGKLDDGNTFQATVLLAKCASRYENAPGKPGEPGSYAPGATPGSEGGHPAGVPKGPSAAPQT